MKYLMKKRIYFIRHGQASHNSDHDQHGEIAYYLPKNIDSHLTDKGREQASTAVATKYVDLVLCSPLTRCLQTAQIMFPHHRIVASDLIRECNYHHPCNRRRPTCLLSEEFPQTDFSDVEPVDTWYHQGDPFDRKVALDKYLSSLPYETIAVVSHGSFLQDFFRYKGWGNQFLDNCGVLFKDM